MSRPKLKTLKELYKNSKDAKVGEQCICPSCRESFIKESYQQAFCKTKAGSKCKDFYWNNVTSNKRNNKTRVSPASARFILGKESSRQRFTIEGYEIRNGIAYDEFGEPMYNIDIYGEL